MANWSINASKYSEKLFEDFYKLDEVVDRFVKIQRFFDNNVGTDDVSKKIKEVFDRTDKDLQFYKILDKTNNYAELRNDIVSNIYSEVENESILLEQIHNTLNEIGQDIIVLEKAYQRVKPSVEEIRNSNIKKY